MGSNVRKVLKESQKKKSVKSGNRKWASTKGQLWSFLQSYKFGANTQPFYIPVDAQGQLLNYSYSYDEDVEKYKNFLQRALENNNIN